MECIVSIDTKGMNTGEMMEIERLLKLVVSEIPKVNVYKYGVYMTTLYSEQDKYMGFVKITV